MYIKLLIGLILLILVIVLSSKTKWNFGILCFAAAFFYNCFVVQGTTTSMLEFFPTRQIILFIVSGAFFSYGANNGTYNKFADWMVYKIGGRTAALPWVLFIIAVVLGCSGASPLATPVILGAIGYALWDKARFDPILIPCASMVGVVTGGYGFWTADAQLRYSYLLNNLGEEATTQATYMLMPLGWIVGIAIFTIFYFFFKGYQNESGLKAIEVEKPEPFDPKQKTTLFLFGVVLFMLIVPALVQIFLPNPATKWLSTYVDIFVLCSVGVIVGELCGVGKVAEAVKSIGWGIILIVAGACTFISLIVAQGFTEVIGNFVQSGIPGWIIPPVFAVAAGLISIFATGSVGYALMAPLIPTLSGMGVSYTGMLCGVFLPPNMTGISPFSGGGANVLNQIRDEKVRDGMINKQFALAFVVCALQAIYALLIGLLL